LHSTDINSLGNENMQPPTSKRLIEILVYYLASLIFSVILVFGVGFTHKDTIVFFAESNKPEFMQLFFPTGAEYSEEASERLAFEGNPGDGIGLTLPNGALKSVRVDPSDEALTILVKSVELRYLFVTITLSPTDLLERITPIQGIDKIEITPNGLLIKTTSDDPQFDLAIYKPSDTRNIIKLIAISIILSLAAFVTLFTITNNNIKKLGRAFTLLTVPTISSLLVTAIFYPGFMTYDSFHALYGARNGVTDSMWPPVVSYVWRLIDLISPNPAIMLFTQLLLLISSVFYIVYHFTKRASISIAFLLFYLSIPAILGTMAAIWKDVLMTSFFVASFAIMLVLKSVNSRTSFWGLFTVSTLLILLGTCSRHNAITAAIPLIFYLAWITTSRPPKKWKTAIIATVALGASLTGVIYYSKIQLDNYSLPEFRKLSGTTTLMQLTRVMDIAGASICENHNLFSETSPSLTLSEIKENYDPRHVNLSAGFFHKITFNNKLDDLWISTAKNHTICFFYNKVMLTKFLVGANKGEQFLIISPQIDTNKYGYSLPKSQLREQMVDYINNTSTWIIFRPWFLYLSAITVFIGVSIAGRTTIETTILYMSAALYFAGLVMFGNAADARLLFYTTTLCLLGGLISVTEIMKARYHRSMAAYRAEQHNNN
jgi:hypothetical protein